MNATHIIVEYLIVLQVKQMYLPSLVVGMQ
jgi:hypothetical protein